MLNKNIHVFDIDGTIIRGEGISKSISEMFGIHFPYQNLTEYNVGKSLVTNKIITDISEFDSDMFFRTYKYNIFEDVEVIEGFLKYIEKLENKNKEILFLTARPMYLEEITHNFFRKIGLSKYVNENRLIMDKHKKGEKLRYVNTTLKDKIVMYEDNDNAINEFSDDGHSVVQVLQPYNMNMNVYQRPILPIETYHDII